MHLAVDPDLYSMEDLAEVKKGTLIDFLEEVMESHQPFVSIFLCNSSFYGAGVDSYGTPSTVLHVTVIFFANVVVCILCCVSLFVL